MAVKFGEFNSLLRSTRDDSEREIPITLQSRLIRATAMSWPIPLIKDLGKFMKNWRNFS